MLLAAPPLVDRPENYWLKVTRTLFLPRYTKFLADLLGLDSSTEISARLINRSRSKRSERSNPFSRRIMQQYNEQSRHN